MKSHRINRGSSITDTHKLITFYDTPTTVPSQMAQPPTSTDSSTLIGQASLDLVQPLPSKLVSFDVASSEGQFMLTWVALILTSLMYLTLTVFGLHNFFKYIVKQQNQLKLLYILAIMAAAGRLGRYIAMIVSMIQGAELHTQLSLMADMFISCLFVGAGMCLTLIMFKLYTYLHCWSIYLHEQRRTFDNN